MVDVCEVKLRKVASIGICKKINLKKALLPRGDPGMPPWELNESIDRARDDLELASM